MQEGLQAADGQAGFEILAITSGNGNGWQFPPETLQASLALWEGVESYIDHAQQPGWKRSVRDLAGILPVAEMGRRLPGDQAAASSIRAGCGITDPAGSRVA